MLKSCPCDELVQARAALAAIWRALDLFDNLPIEAAITAIERLQQDNKRAKRDNELLSAPLLRIGEVLRQSMPRAKPGTDFADVVRELAQERDNARDNAVEGAMEVHRKLRQERDYHKDIADQRGRTLESLRDELRGIREELRHARERADKCPL